MANPIQIGDRFTHLLVVKRSTRIDNRGERWWLCQCDCGTTKAIRAGNLRTGNVKSCGCFRSNRMTTWNKEKAKGANPKV